jgi:hypothetical protein
MQPYLFIGVGGSGGKVLRYLWREIDRRMPPEWTERRLPNCFGFLHIDLPHEYDGHGELDIPVVADLQGRHYMGLGRRNVTYETYDRELRDPRRIHGFVRWRPYPLDRIPPPHRGAGQRRAVGRVLAVSRLDDIRSQIDRSLEALTVDRGDLDALEELFPSDVGPGQGAVVIVGSLAGGSGSGIVLDVVEAVRSSEKAFGENIDPYTILIAPDVFDGVGPDTGIYPNALAALAELVNAAEATGPLPRAERELRGKVLTDGSGPRLGRMNFIIGKSNGAVTFASPRHVYQAVGRMLGALALTSRHQVDFEQYIAQNAADDAIRRRLGRAGTFSSIGYVVVGLGRHLFRDYAAERLARRAFDRLSWGHEERYPADLPEVRLQRQVDEVWLIGTTGAGRSGGLLAELELGTDQLLGRQAYLEGMRERLTRVAADVVGELKGHRGRRDGAFWNKEHATAWAIRHQRAEAAENQHLGEAFGAWAAGQQDRLLGVVVRVASQRGLEVAIKLLERLLDDLDDRARGLQRDGRELMNRSNRQAVRAAKSAESMHRARGDDDRLANEVAHPQLLSWQNTYEAHALDLARRQMHDVRDNLVRPLRDALSSSLRQIRDLEETEPHRTRIRRWSRGPVPLHLHPASNEVLVEPVRGFPDTFDTLLQQLFEEPADNALQRAAEEVLVGAWQTPVARPGNRAEVGEVNALPPVEGASSGSEQTLIRVRGEWHPAEGPAWFDGARSGAVARFKISLDVDGLLERADQWVRHRDGPIGKFVVESLADYLADDMLGAQREHTFAQVFAQGLAKSAPFVHIDANTSTELHGNPGADTIASVSTIPVAKLPGTTLYDALVRALDAVGIDANRVAFEEASGAKDVDILRYPRMKFHPAALRSVTGPIAQDWSRRQARPSDASEFWKARRSRTLPMFVPLGHDDQVGLVGGWLVASLLTYVEAPNGTAWSARRRVLWSPEALLPLPEHLLVASGDEPVNARGVLPALLESFPLTWLDVTSGQSALPAYERLMELGTVHDRRYHPEIRYWIEHGARMPGKVAHLRPELEAEAKDGTADQRKQALIAHFRRLEERAQASIPPSSEISHAELATDPRDVPPGIETAELACEALSALIKAIDGDDRPDENDPV